MIRNFFRGLVVFAVLVTSWSVGGLVPAADAASTLYSQKCAVVQQATVGNLNWGRVTPTRQCVAQTVNAVGGTSYLSRNALAVRFNPYYSSSTQIGKTTTHELTHFVEYRTTPAMRTKLYSYLGISMNGNYYSIPTASGTNLTAWKANPRERLAESVVKCRFGSNSFSGMSLVPSTRCYAFIMTLKQAIAAVR